MHTHALLPRDLPDNRLLGRLWDPENPGPRLVTVRSGALLGDLTRRVTGRS